MLYKAENGKLNPWEDGEFLESINDVWVSKNANSPWSFQIMFIDSVNDNWVYRREKSIKQPKSSIYKNERRHPLFKARNSTSL